MTLSNPLKTDHRPLQEAQALIHAGHEVTVIVWDRNASYTEKETYQKIHISRIHNTGLMNHFSNATVQNPLWWKQAYQRALHLYHHTFKFDIVHCHDLDTLPIGVKLKKKTRCKLVYDAHEIFKYMDASPITTTLASIMERRLITHTDHIIAAYQPITDYIQKKTNTPITTILNCKKLITKTYTPPQNPVFTLCYIGNLVPSRMFPQLIDIIGNIPNIRFIIAGRKSGLYEQIKHHTTRYKNIAFLGEIPAEDVIPTTQKSNAIICLFDPARKAHQIGLPNKIFEAMVTGRPIIVTKNLYYSTHFVDKEHFGISISNTPEEITNAIQKLRDSPTLCKKLGNNGLAAAHKKYNWDIQQKKLITLYNQLT